MVTAGDFGERRAPYAPISALEKFFERIRDRSVPDHVDHRFLERLGVASNNEYALLSALKFLGILDDRGRPTHAYRLLQTTDRFQETLRHLVETAYAPVFDTGADSWPADELIDFFKMSSSPSQGRNAARFFRAVCRLAGINMSPFRATASQSAEAGESPGAVVWPADGSPAATENLLAAKARLLEKLPAARPEWSAAEYQAVCDRFIAMLRSLDGAG